MTRVDTIVIGAGHAGLAVSRLLTEAGREHVVLDRGRVAERWRSERWDSLHLLSPNWMTRLPGWWYGGADPDGYMSGARFTHFLERYAASFDAPVVGGTAVRELSAAADGYRVDTDNGGWHARQVVIATGPHGTPVVPAGLDRLADVEVVTANRYRNPDRLAAGGVLVVGASASALQIADELVRAGREVTLAAGRHTRMPRRYRGMDSFWWLHTTGRQARTIDQMPDPDAARREPSLQLVGRNDPGRHGADLDLGTLRVRGVRLTGRVLGVDGGTVLRLADDLGENVAVAEQQLHGFLDTVDHHIACNRLSGEVWAPDRPRPVEVPATPTSLDLRAEGIGTVLVAAGYRPHHPWLRLPVTGPDGHIRQHRGVTAASGVYVVGQRFQHRRDSATIDGARHDARAVVGHLLARCEDDRELQSSGEESAA